MSVGNKIPSKINALYPSGPPRMSAGNCAVKEESPRINSIFKKLFFTETMLLNLLLSHDHSKPRIIPPAMIPIIPKFKYHPDAWWMVYPCPFMA